MFHHYCNKITYFEIDCLKVHQLLTISKQILINLTNKFFMLSFENVSILVINVFTNSLHLQNSQHDGCRNGQSYCLTVESNNGRICGHNKKQVSLAYNILAQKPKLLLFCCICNSCDVKIKVIIFDAYFVCCSIRCLRTILLSVE